MQRYGEHAAAELAGTCVPAGSEGSSGMSDSGVPPSSEVDTGTDDVPVVDETTDTGSTGPSVPPLDTGGEGPSSSEGDGSSTTTTTGEPAGCEVVLYDGFDDGRIGMEWDSWQDSGTLLEEADSVLRMSIVGAALPGDDAGVHSVESFDLTAGYLRLEVAELPTPNTDMQLYWQLVSEACTLQGLVQEGLVYAFDEVIEYGADTQWLQMRFEGGQGYLERSTDGLTWELMLDPVGLACQPGAVEVYVFGGAGEATMLEGTAAVGTVEACGALAQ